MKSRKVLAIVNSEGKTMNFCFGFAVLNFFAATVFTVISGGEAGFGSLAAGLCCLTIGIAKCK